MKTVKLWVLCCTVCVVSVIGMMQSAEANFYNTESQDGTTIAYSIYGKGEATLVFVHGWSCDSRYWVNQIPYFSSKYRVITIDLAGHGNSGLSREEYTVKAFGQDIVAVLEKLDVDNAILIGHSMGGEIVLQAAVLAPDRVSGIIGIDTLHDMGHYATEEEIAGVYTPLAEDFETNAAAFVGSMFPKGSDAVLVETVSKDMSSAPAKVALNILSNYFKIAGEEFLTDIKVPIMLLNADLWPTNVDGNKNLYADYEMVLMEGYGHFIMLEAPDEFNQNLDALVQKVFVSTRAE